MDVVGGLKLPLLAAFFNIDGVQVSRHRGHVQNSGAQHRSGADGASHANVPAHMVGRLGGPNPQASGARIVVEQRGPVSFRYRRNGGLRRSWHVVG